MTTAAEVITAAQAQVGYVEGGGPDGRSGNITKYWAELDPAFQGEPWCAAFVSWVFIHAGHPLPAIDHPFGFTYCPDAVNYARAHSLWSASGHYAPGDVVFYDFEAANVASHTGIIVSDDGQTMHTIEGNTSPDNTGSQSNGGGVYARTRAHGPQVLGVLQMSKLLQTSVSTPTPIPAPVQTPERFFVKTVLYARRSTVDLSAAMWYMSALGSADVAVVCNPDAAIAAHAAGATVVAVGGPACVDLAAIPGLVKIDGATAIDTGAKLAALTL